MFDLYLNHIKLVFTTRHGTEELIKIWRVLLSANQQLCDSYRHYTDARLHARTIHTHPKTGKPITKSGKQQHCVYTLE